MEKDIEKYFVKSIKDIGGKAYKFVSPGNTGVPDRLVCLPNGKMFFVEFKDKGKNLSPMQNVQRNRLKKLGFTVFVIDSKESAFDILTRGIYCVV